VMNIVQPNYCRTVIIEFLPLLLHQRSVAQLM
jgi:hypothetical protein